MQTLTNLDHLKLLGHPKRLALLQYLMEQSATLSQLGGIFHESAAHIRHHVKQLEEAGFVIQTDPPPHHNHLEKYYKATAEAWMVQLAVLPKPFENETPFVIASKDIGTSQMVREFSQKVSGMRPQILPMNSLDGLVHLRNGLCQMATCHLKEPDSEQYNRSFVRHLFPGQPMAVISLFQREEGLIMHPGNPLAIRNLIDLARPDIRFINRERGSGIRLWLDQALKAQKISPENISGYSNEAHSHAEVAQMIQEGKADTGLGIAAAAHSLGMAFIPLFEEPYELVFSGELISNPQYAPFFNHLNSGKFSASVSSLDGYLITASSSRLEWVS